MSKRIGGHKPIRAGVLAAVVLLGTGCLGQEAPSEGPVLPTIEFVAVNPVTEQSEPSDYSIVFAEADATREALPLEVKLERNADSSRMVGVIAFKKHILNEAHDVTSIQCFAEPIRLRDNLTGEILAELTEFCPPGNEHNWVRILGINDDEQEIVIQPPQ